MSYRNDFFLQPSFKRQRHHLIDLNFLEDCSSYFTSRVILTYTITSRVGKNAVVYDLCYMISARLLEMLCFLRWQHRRISQHLLNESKRCSLYRSHILFHMHKSLQRILDVEYRRWCGDWLWNGEDSSFIPGERQNSRLVLGST
jgi:hypothetical protein